MEIFNLALVHYLVLAYFTMYASTYLHPRNPNTRLNFVGGRVEPRFHSFFGDSSSEEAKSKTTPKSTNSTTDGSDERIVDGRPASNGEAPYQLSLLLDNDHICGATLAVSPMSGMQYGITAAHCVTNVGRGGIADRGPEEYRVRGGSLNRNQGQTLAVAEFIVHEGWRAKYHFDLAILFFHGQFELGENLRPIDLSTKRKQESFREIIVSGWGALEEGGRVYPTNLQIVKIPRLRTTYCNRVLQRQMRTRKMVVGQDQICAGLERGGKDACQGDSGGPAVAEDTRGKYLVGVVSFGEGCARPGLPGVFTRVYYYKNWIQGVVDQYELYGGVGRGQHGHRHGHGGRKDGNGTEPDTTGKTGATTEKPGSTAKPGASTKKP